MKKLLAVTVLFTAFSFTSLDANAKTQDCVSLAIDVYDAYHNNGYTKEEAYQAGNWAYEGCISNGGN